MKIVTLEELSDPFPPAGESSMAIPQNDPAWIGVLRAMGENAGALVAVDAGVVAGWLLFTKRDSPLGSVFSSTPYLAYGGPVSARDDADVMRALIRSYRALAIESGALAASMGTPPFLDGPTEELWRQEFAPTYVFENSLQISLLDRHPLDVLPKKLRDSKLRQIRSAAVAGYRVAREKSVERFDEWVGLYTRRYEEIGALPYPVTFFRALYDQILSAGKAELWVSYLGDELVGGTLFLVDGVTTDYFASAYATAHRSQSPQYSVLDQAFRDFLNRGFRRVNWESSPSQNSGVHTFKARWGAQDSRHFYYSLVLDKSLLGRSAHEIQTAFPLRFVVPFSELVEP